MWELTMTRQHIALAALTAALAASPAFAAPGDMNAAIFLQKAEALQARGAMAMFSSDIRVLMAEGQAAGRAYRAQLEGERRAGRPSSCPPEHARMGSDQLLAHLRSYSPEQRQRITMRAAMADLFRKTYPCPQG